MKNDNHLINRSQESFVLKGAIDKPIDIYFHHYHKLALTINHETGDIYSELFNQKGTEEFFRSPLRKLDCDVFFQDEGKKSVYIFESNARARKADISAFIDFLKEKGVEFGGNFISNVHDSSGLEEKYGTGEIGTMFALDLKTKQVKAFYSKVEGDGRIEASFTESAELPDVEGRESKIPNIKEVEDHYFKLRSATNLITWADITRLKEAHTQNPIDFKELFDLQSYVGKAISEASKIEGKPFAKEYLYKHEYINNIQETLNFLKQNEVGSESLAALASHAAFGFVKSFADVWVQRPDNLIGSFELREEPLPHYAKEFGRNFTNFAVKLCKEEESQSKRENCIEIMKHNVSAMMKVLGQDKTLEAATLKQLGD